jgi:MFS family permease
MMNPAGSPRRALAAAISLIVITSNSTSTSALFVAYRTHWGLTAADIGVAFAVYVGSLIPVLLLFGGLAERFGRRAVILAGTLFMLAGTLTLVFANGLPLLIVARLLQGAGAALGVGAISATFTESYRGRIASGQALAVVTAVALAGGPIVTAIAYDVGSGPNLSYLPVLLLGVATLSLVPIFPGRLGLQGTTAPAETPLPASTVWRGLRFAMPAVFVGWAGNALYLSLVPAYIAETLHVSDPLVGAGAFWATQLATIFGSIAVGNAPAERNGIMGPFMAVVGLVLLVVGTSAHNWPLIIIATVLVGAGCGIAGGAAYAITAVVGRGQRARIFARLLVMAYAGYSLPSLLIGIIATRASFGVAFSVAIAWLAAIAAALPFLRRGYPAPALATAPASASSSAAAVYQHRDARQEGVTRV